MKLKKTRWLGINKAIHLRNIALSIIKLSHLVANNSGWYQLQLALLCNWQLVGTSEISSPCGTRWLSSNRSCWLYSFTNYWKKKNLRKLNIFRYKLFIPTVKQFSRYVYAIFDNLIWKINYVQQYYHSVFYSSCFERNWKLCSRVWYTQPCS